MRLLVSSNWIYVPKCTKFKIDLVKPEEFIIRRLDEEDTWTNRLSIFTKLLDVMKGDACCSHPGLILTLRYHQCDYFALQMNFTLENKKYCCHSKTRQK